MDIQSVLSKIPKEKLDIYEQSPFLRAFGDFLLHYFSFITSFLILLLWQILVIIHSPYSSAVLELFICIAIVQHISEKFLKSVYFIIPIIVNIGVIIVLKQYELPTEQWILILGILIGLKVNSFFKKDKVIK